ncbi:MAG: hypothetical protein L0G99_02580 [Propionibacteriales bacterium]|nr:hypothetical protein [Propionibacteriales bacterium]
MSTQTLMVTDRRIPLEETRPAPRATPGRRPARRAPRVLGPRTGAARRVARPQGVPAPRLRPAPFITAAPRAVQASPQLGWRLSDRGLAVVMGIGGLLVAMAMVAIVGTFFAVTAEVPPVAPVAHLG